jgi:hypothetical protein
MATSCHACVAARRYSKASDTARSRRTRHPLPSQAARPGPPQATRTRTRRETHGRCSAEPQSSWCFCVRSSARAGGQKARGTPSQTFGSKWATKVKRQVGQVARPHGRTRRRHPCASKGPPSPPAPSVASSRYPRVASRKACDTITSAAGAPSVATGLAAGRTWGSGVRGWAAQCVGRVRRVSSRAGWRQLYTVAREPSWHGSEAAGWRGGGPGGRAGGWGPVPAASAPALARRLQRRGAVLFVLRLGKAATDGRAVGHPGHSAARARPGPDAVVARVKNNSGVYPPHRALCPLSSSSVDARAQ